MLTVSVSSSVSWQVPGKFLLQIQSLHACVGYVLSFTQACILRRHLLVVWALPHLSCFFYQGFLVYLGPLLSFFWALTFWGWRLLHSVILSTWWSKVILPTLDIALLLWPEFKWRGLAVTKHFSCILLSCSFLLWQCPISPCTLFSYRDVGLSGTMTLWFQSSCWEFKLWRPYFNISQRVLLSLWFSYYPLSVFFQARLGRCLVPKHLRL